MITLEDNVAVVLEVAFIGLLLFALLVMMTSQNYVKARLKQKIKGGKFIHEIDVDNNSNFDAVSSSQDELKCRDRTHTIEPLSGLRNPDGPIYYVHKDMVKALTPQSIISANNMMKLGFKRFAHAAEFYKAEYFDSDWVAVKSETEPLKKKRMEAELEQKIGLNLMSPVQPDSFTMNLSILNNWNNQKLSAYGLKNIADKIKVEAERENMMGGLNGNKIFTYVTAIIALLCGLAFALRIAGKI